jgi:23S rRNA-/tRNA-specific pseudouridylate synthase
MTSGTVVVARNRKSLRQLCQQFATRIVGKEYLAWVSGDPPSEGSWEDSMRKVPNEPRAELSSLDQEHSRTATLEYRVLRQRTGPQNQLESLLLIQLGTGRMHQIRLQCGSRGFPILGDRLYGSQKPWIPETGIPETGTPNPEYREPPIALHAFRLTFHHPQTAERITATAPPPAQFPWGNEPLSPSETTVSVRGSPPTAWLGTRYAVKCSSQGRLPIGPTLSTATTPAPL